MSVDFQEIVNTIMRRTDAVRLWSEVNQRLRDEQNRREKFYQDITETEKAEFINGEIVIHSPVRSVHNVVLTNLSSLITAYTNSREIGYVGVEKVMITLTRNDYEPDIVFFGTEKSATITEDQVLFPAPDFIVEILSNSTARNDRTVKFEDYQSHAVREYWIIDPETKIVEQYLLKEGTYNLRLKSDSGTIRSAVIEGFDIPIQAIFDKKLNVQTLKEMLL